jgi:hypothetical protein
MLLATLFNEIRQQLRANDQHGKRAARTSLFVDVQIIIVVISFHTFSVFEIDRNLVFMLFQYQMESFG